MKIDTYSSSKMPSYGVVVPAGTDLTTLQGEAGAAVANLSPLTVRSKGATLGDVFKGDLLAHLEAQIAAEGAGLVKTQGQFSEATETTQPSAPIAKPSDGRSREAREARKAAKLALADAPLNRISMQQSIQEHQYETALASTDVKAALLEHEGAQARRDSISRKLCGGSTAVTVTDLARWEAALSEANKVLADLARHEPILKRHPVIAAAIAHH